MSCIYLITNKINNMQYIGQTTGKLKRRLSQHFMNSNKKGLLSYAAKEFGRDNFLIEILAETDDIQELNMLEEYYINKYNTLHPNGYNLVPGGSNKKHNELSKKLMSEKNKERCKYIKIDKDMRPLEATNVETGEVIVFPGFKYALQAGFKATCIRRVLHGERPSHNGFTFKQLEKIKQDPVKRIDKRYRSIIAKNVKTNQTITFETITAAKKAGFYHTHIWRVLTGQIDQYKGHTFEYTDKVGSLG